MQRFPIFIFFTCVLAGCSTNGVTVENTGHGDVAMPSGATRKIIKQVPPEYPAPLRAKGIVGTVVVRLWVRPDGSVAKAEGRYSPRPELIPLAVAAVKKWQLEPAKEGDQRVIMLETPITFELREPAKK